MAAEGGFTVPGGAAPGLRVAVLASRFHSQVCERLLAGCRDALRQRGAVAAEVLRVPGAFELPLAARWLADRMPPARPEAIVALGAVIRGETAHFDYISSACVRGLAAVARDSRLPVSLGVLTTDTLQQALARCPEGEDNKGYQAALAAIEMALLRRQQGRDQQDRDDT